MKITDVEIIPVFPRVVPRNQDKYAYYGDVSRITIFKVHTDAGIVGYGEMRGAPPPQSAAEPVIGRNPFDFINSNLNHGLIAALYDAMGKHLEVPAYKLMGQKCRDAVSTAAWTRPCSPQEFREEVRHAAQQGYTILKMHTSARYDVMEQTRLAEEVAPEGFRIHYDFNGGALSGGRSSRTIATVLPLLRELEKHPIVGFVEDPLARYDIHGWRTLRERTRIPLILGHSGMLGLAMEVSLGMADLYMIGGSGIGGTLDRGTALGLMNTQVMFQLVGNTLSKALALHMAAVLPTATGHSICQEDQYEEDLVVERLPVHEGFSPVPEKPGLGIEVDEDALQRLASNPDPYQSIQRNIGILNLPYGKKLYTLSFPDVNRLTGTEEGAIRGIGFEFWQDDGSSEFQQLYQRLEKEGSFME